MSFDDWDLVVQVGPDSDDDEQAPVLAQRLCAELLDLDITAAERISAGDIPAGAKSVSAVATAIGVRLGGAALTSLLSKIRDWATRNGRSVELTIDGDSVKAVGITREQQDKLISVWVARHASGN